MKRAFELQEGLYRAVYPPEIMPLYWKEKGQVSSAVFKDKRGLSVEREVERTEKRVIEYMKCMFKGCIIRIKVEDCIACNSVVKHIPTSRSKYHSEIHGSEDRILLSPSQCKSLAKAAYIIG